jgi:hypothetical protein
MLTSWNMPIQMGLLLDPILDGLKIILQTVRVLVQFLLGNLVEFFLAENSDKLFWHYVYIFGSTSLCGDLMLLLGCGILNCPSVMVLK